MPKQTRKQSIKGKSATSTRTRNVHEAEEHRLQESIERLKRDKEKKRNKHKIHNFRSSKSISESVERQPFVKPYNHPDIEKETNRSANLSSDEEDIRNLGNGNGDDRNYQFETNPFVNEKEVLGDDPEIDDSDFKNTKLKFNDSWILFWIFKYQERFKLPDVAINSLIGFFNLILKDADLQRFDKFPPIAHIAQKFLEIKKKSKIYAVCPKCNKLYNIANITLSDQSNSKFNGFRCDHVEFPNHTLRNQRESCETELLKRVPVVNGYIWKPKMIYPLPCLKTQLSIMYQRPDASESKFFTAGTADFHLGIMINLNWFQPFESSIYSCGVIYGDGVDLPKTEINSAGKRIRLAVICCSNDILTERKLYGHISVLAGCHRCYKRASSKNGERANFGGFEDMPNWFKMRDPEEHRHNAILWKYKPTKENRKQHVRTTYVRWSEMLRLPYHNLIRHLIVDPMHCLFLGIAHWIVKKIWIDGRKLTKSHLEIMKSRAKQIKIPANLERIPSKISTGEGFSGFTTDQ
ncbi:hypothetical protein RhiirC2_781276 [Rhizophagus irregularis]|uniref:Transposase domain-containing protein n=1 Tax=Rhizophagus irregularis TaxID=588596 RepID=A0A2N1N5T8_9GLOM|nr:hypothetical protein RhiirC2_781276 [Rhizophagus irregularis]